MENKEYEYAGFWIRAVASLIDGILFAIIIIPLLAMIYGDSWTGGGEVAIRGPAEFLIQYVFPFIAVVLFWYYRSATPGKMALNLAIVNADDGGKLSIGQCIGRYFAYIPAMLILMIGIIWVAFDKRKQGWHDKLAGTLVIKKYGVVRR